MSHARVACLVVALAGACGDDTAEIEQDSRRQKAADRARVEAEAARLEAEVAAIAGDGKHWYDVPKPGQLQPGLHECERYLAAIRSFVACTQLPAGTRDALRQSIDSLSSSWRSAMSPDGLAAANQGCRLGVQGLIDTALMSNCSLDIPP